MFAILFEVLLIETQEEIHHFAGSEGVRLRGTKIMNKTFCEQIQARRRHINFEHKLFETAVNPGTTSQLTRRNVYFLRFGGEHINFLSG